MHGGGGFLHLAPPMISFQRSRERQERHVCLLAIFAVLVMLATALVPVASVSDGATPWSGTDSWKVVLHTETDKNKCEQLTVHLYKNGSEVTDLESIARDTPATENPTYVSNTKNADGSRKNVGSWGFNDDGYGPFNSFYAAFDLSDSNRMVCHLDPYDLTKSVDGRTAVSIDGKDVKISDCNIMWCLPTVYWKTDSGDLVLTDDPDSGGTAYAHTVYGPSGEKEVFPYVAYGVYEAGTAAVGEDTVLTSRSDATVLTDESRKTFRGYANSQSVDVTGEGSGGYAMLWNFYQYELYKYCAMAIMGSWDSRTVAGNGCVVHSGDVYYMTPGLLNGSGPYAGTRGTAQSAYTDSVKVFIENAWGSVYDFVDGVVFHERAYCIDQKSVPDDSVADDGEWMTILTETLPSTGWGSAPSKRAEIWGMPTGNGGGSASGTYSYVWSNTGDRLLHAGGSSLGSYWLGYFGLSSMDANSNGLNFSYPTIGGRLAFLFDQDPEGRHTATFDTDGGTGDFPPVTVRKGERFAIPDDVPIKDGYSFGGWSDGETVYPQGATVTMGAGDIVFTAQWTDSPVRTVTFDLDGGVWDLDREVSVAGGTYVVPDAVPTKGGCAFGGWMCGDVRIGQGERIELDSDIILKAVWTVRIVPIIPDDPEAVEIVDDGGGGASGKDGRNILLIAVAVVIIAELAVLSISGRR